LVNSQIFTNALLHRATSVCWNWPDWAEIPSEA